MQEITKNIQQVSTTVNLELKSDKQYQSLKHIGKTIRRWSSLIVGFILLGSLVLLTVLNGGLFMKEVLISSFIIACLLFLKGPNSVENGEKSN